MSTKDDFINLSVNDKGVCRTSLATLALKNKFSGLIRGPNLFCNAEHLTNRLVKIIVGLVSCSNTIQFNCKTI